MTEKILGSVREGQQFKYKHEKAFTRVVVEAQLSDGSRIGCPIKGSGYSKPFALLDAATETLHQAVARVLAVPGSSVELSRLKLEGVFSHEGAVDILYSVTLSNEESKIIRSSHQSDSPWEIIPAGSKVDSPAQHETDHLRRTAQPGDALAKSSTTAGSDEAGEYIYSRPMADHTGTVAFIFRDENSRYQVITGLRKKDPFAGKDALPGGFLDFHCGAIEQPEAAAVREMMEETGLKIHSPILVRIGDAIDRDPRNRVIDFQYLVLGSKEDLKSLFAGDDLKDVRARDVQELLADPKILAFDHHLALTAAFEHV